MTSSRRRRPVLPALSAALVGALTAGAATLITNAEVVSAHPGQVNLAVENPAELDPDLADTDGATGTLTPDSTTGAPPADPPTSSAAPTSSSTAPTTTSPDPEPSDEPPPPPPDPPAPPEVTEEEQVVTLVNAARAQRGCDPVTVDHRLVQAAENHSSDMADRDYFDHTTPDGVGFAERIVDAGYPSPGAENIARGQTSATQVMNSWMDSAGHRANILNCQLSTLGVGLDKDGWYWTQNFGY